MALKRLCPLISAQLRNPGAVRVMLICHISAGDCPGAAKEKLAAAALSCREPVSDLRPGQKRDDCHRAAFVLIANWLNKAGAHCAS